MSKISELIQVTLEERQLILKSFEKCQEDLDSCVREIREWLRGQPHLPQMIDDKKLESMIIRNKFRVEKTKTKIDAYYTLRGRHKFYFNVDLILPKGYVMRELLEINNLVVFPKLTNELGRLLVYKLKDPSRCSPCLHISAFGFLLVDFIMSNDFSLGEVVVVDLKGFQLSKWLTYDIVTLWKTLHLYKDGFSGRLRGMHVINAPYFMEFISVIIKTIVHQEKFIVHKTMDSLYEHIPQKYLPKDYGGDQAYLDDIQEQWNEEIEVQLDKIQEMFKETSDETKRQKIKESRGFFQNIWR